MVNQSRTNEAPGFAVSATSGPNGPLCVVIVYDEIVGVTNRVMPVWMAVRFFSFPTLVFMVVMGPMGMHVLVDCLAVGVKQIHWIVAGP